MKKIVFWLFLSSLLLSSCNNSETRKGGEISIQKVFQFPYFIDIEKSMENPKSVLLSEIGNKLEYIPLETSPESMIGGINQIEFCRDFIFVYTNRPSKVLQFDRRGKFIRQVGKNGRGPGEYIGVVAFCINQRNKRVYIYTYGVFTIQEYNFEGEFIKTLKVPWGSTQFLVYDTTGFVFHVYDVGSDSPTFKDITKNSLYVTDFNLNERFRIKKHLIRKGNVSIEVTPLYYFNNNLYFKQYAVDTLYTLKNEQLEPYVVFSLGKQKMDPNLLFNQFNRHEVWKKIENDIEIEEISENKDYLFTKINIGFSDSSKLCIFNKLTSETTILNNNGFVNDLDGGISFWPKYVQNNEGILVDYFNPYDFLNKIRSSNSNELKGKYGDNYAQIEKFINELAETSNPVLVILK